MAILIIFEGGKPPEKDFTYKQWEIEFNMFTCIWMTFIFVYHILMLVEDNDFKMNISILWSFFHIFLKVELPTISRARNYKF